MMIVFVKPAFLFSNRIDVELPIECDDEYWETEDPQKAFQQPPGKPCSVSNFIHYIQLCEILGFALRTLYSTKKSKILTGLIGNDWEGRIVAELDSSLNSWKDSLPRHRSLFSFILLNLLKSYPQCVGMRRDRTPLSSISLQYCTRYIITHRFKYTGLSYLKNRHYRFHPLPCVQMQLVLVPMFWKQLCPGALAFSPI